MATTRLLVSVWDGIEIKDLPEFEAVIPAHIEEN